jgi:hypothetical protein
MIPTPIGVDRGPLGYWQVFFASGPSKVLRVLLLKDFILTVEVIDRDEFDASTSDNFG